MPSILDTFIALSLETTGANPAESEIAAIGAVKIENGEIIDHFPSPGAKTARKTRRIETAIQDMMAFAGDLPIIAYEGGLEVRFLSKTSGLSFGGHIHGLRDLACAVLPYLPDHGIDNLAGFFNIQDTNKHSALKTAEQVAGIYQGLIATLQETPLRLKQQMLQLLQGTTSPLLPIFVALCNEAVRREFMTRIRGGGADQPLFNIGGDEVRASEESGNIQPIDTDGVCALFQSGGLFAKHNHHYEVRTEQIEMARAVCEAFNNGQLLVVEAGTGVGKSMAYLVPAIHHAALNNRRVIVSTNTKNLQEQLFFKDLPHLEQTLDVPFSYVLLKGRSNYICLNRWNAALANVESAFSETERIAALPLVLWAEQTKTGDIAENNGFDALRNAGLWAKVCSDPGYCRSQRCRTNGRCYANVVRRAAQKAHLVVVNHSLLFSDIAAENAVLGEYEDLVLDEAHNIEKVAASYLGRELSIWRIKNLTDQLRSPGFNSTGTLPALRHWMGVARLDDTVLSTFETGIAQAMEAAEALYLKAQFFFEGLTDHLRQKQGARQNAYVEKMRYKPGQDTFCPLEDTRLPLLQAAGHLTNRLQALCNWLKDLREDAFPNRDELTGELESRAQESADILADLEYLTEPQDEQAVYWLELPARDNSSDTRLFAAPLNVADVLCETLYDRLNAIVFTSATLGIRGKLTYFLRRMGLETLPEGRVRPLCLGSPFNYETQALVCAPQFVPSPKSPDFQNAVDGILRDLALNVKRGALALFTSYAMLNRTYLALKPDLQTEGILLLGQGIDGSRAGITDRFKTDRGSMLLGTDSFWEGVDIPGEALEILGIVRLPFAVPSEPLVAAHMEELEKQGKDPFLYYSVPEAILKFRQGFGRLIRNKTDRGVVVVLDSRVLTTRYGRAFLEALPVAHKTFKTPQDMVQTIQKWFAQPL